MNDQQANNVRRMIGHYTAKLNVSETELVRFCDVSADRLIGFQRGAIPVLDESELIRLGDVVTDLDAAEQADADAEKWYGRPHTQTLRDVILGKGAK